MLKKNIYLTARLEMAQIAPKMAASSKAADFRGLIKRNFLRLSTYFDQGAGDIWVSDPAGDDQRLLLLHVQNIGPHLWIVHKWLLTV